MWWYCFTGTLMFPTRGRSCGGEMNSSSRSMQHPFLDGFHGCRLYSVLTKEWGRKGKGGFRRNRERVDTCRFICISLAAYSDYHAQEMWGI